MAKFKFKFDSIIRVKEILQKRIQEEIASIDKEINNLRHQLSVVNEERKKNLHSMLARPLKAAEFQSAKVYDSILEKQIIAIQKKIDLCIVKRNEKNLELVEKKKEQKVFETLKENKQAEYDIDERRMELKEINEIGIRKYSGNQN